MGDAQNELEAIETGKLRLAGRRQPHLGTSADKAGGRHCWQ
jgi:hypothetical protein